MLEVESETRPAVGRDPGAFHGTVFRERVVDSTPDDGKGTEEVPPCTDTSLVRLVGEVFPACLLAGCGMVLAGTLIDTVHTWPVFRAYPQVIIMIPALLGLKGNLEMTLASRLSTVAHIGVINNSSGLREAAIGNLILTQIQAIGVGFLAALLATLINLVEGAQLVLPSVGFLCCASILTASITSFLLGLVMIGVVLISVHWNVDPDNVATPAAASLGDLTTLFVLVIVSSTLDIYGSWWLLVSILILWSLLVLFLVWISRDRWVVRQGLRSGWTPVLSAMVISSLGGAILHRFVSRLKHLAVFQPVINGVGGNLVAVLASRLSTQLHKQAKMNIESDFDARVPILILCMTIPVHLLLVMFVVAMPFVELPITLAFLIAYLTAALIQVACLLRFGQWLVPVLWSRGIDPDNAAIPYATSVGDLMGTACLTVALCIAVDS